MFPREGERPLIAVVQYAPEWRLVVRNRELSRDRIAAAAERGASLVVLPECCTTGLAFDERADLLELAEPADGPTAPLWSEIARERRIWIVGGIAERDGDGLFNTAVVVGPHGLVCRYRKTHTFGRERNLFDLGETLVSFDTPWGRVGLAICYDLWFPEVARTLALNGAGLIAVPSNWFVPPRQAADADDAAPMAFHLATAAACSNEVTIACAGRTGVENGTRFIGGSFIIGPNGRPLAGPASRTGDEILVARWPDPAETRALVQSHLQTRQPALYAMPVEIAPAVIERAS